MGEGNWQATTGDAALPFRRAGTHTGRAQLMTLGIAIFVAVGMAFFLLKSRIQYLSLPNLPKNTAHPATNVTVVIPARNEERNIARVVEAFLASR